MQSDDHHHVLVDLDGEPLFDIERCDESTTGAGAPDDPGPEVRPKGGLVREGVTIYDDIVPFGNGRLPDHALVPIGIHRHRLHRSAAAAFAGWRSAASGAGTDLTCTDSYRPLDVQIEPKRRKPDLAATPGKSVHGRGFAVDVSLGLPPKPFGNPVYECLKANGPAHGWHLGRPCDEPWRWVCRGPTEPTAAGEPPAATGESDEIPASWALCPTIVGKPLGVDALDATALDAAVRAFQGGNGLAVDGIVGPITTAAPWRASAPADRTELFEGANGDAVRWVQLRVGCTDDGRFGPITDRAVRDFQRASGLAADGRVGPRTWAAMVG